MDSSPRYSFLRSNFLRLSSWPARVLLLFSLLLSCFSGLSRASQQADDGGAANYHLAISFNLEQNELIGTAKIVIPAGEKLSLHLGSLKITGKLLKRQDGSTQSLTLPSTNSFSIPAADHARELLLSYSKRFANDGQNLITEQGITLLDSWHPIADKKMRFKLSARLPENFTAVVEADTFPLKVHNDTVTAYFSQPVQNLHFAAAPYSVSSFKIREGLKVYTLFFQEDAPLARGYLTKARDYIKRYEKEIGPFPYNHYVIAANRLPTGLGMPTFTLLGQSVLRLPFIKDTSLGHEVLHSWFGNSIDVDYQQGNWCEGLTSYLADHAFRADIQEGTAYRKEALLNYLNYVNDANRIPLARFTTASHNQPLAKARRAVGYSRAMMLFHELRTLLGDEHFFTSIRNFYTTYKGRTASWDDIREIFSQTSKRDLGRFFNERLNRDDLPILGVRDIASRSFANGHRLSFTLIQATDEPYQLQVPVRISTTRGDIWFTIDTQATEKLVLLELDSPPLEISFDPEYSLFRDLSEEERPAVWSQFMGAQKKLAIISDHEKTAHYQSMIDHLTDSSWRLQDDGQTGNSELAESDLLFLGLEGRNVQSLFAAPSLPKTGFTLEVHPNPLNHEHSAVLVFSSDAEQTASAASRLSHYGKFSFLHFENGRIKARATSASSNGLNFALEELPQGAATSNLQSFSAIADQLGQNDVIYLGEQHTSMSDHRLQLRIIEAVHDRHPDISIGMEMFPYTSQQALDRYTQQNTGMSEREFLKASGYFSVWRYDYRYFQDIFTFARNNRIPVIGLNLPRETVSTVYSSGSTDDLSDEVRNSLPQQRDLSLPGYARQLREMQAMHQQGGHGTGYASGFIQAQSLWDETMAHNVAVHLKKHPGRKMIILAGSQHTRKDFGIPPRVARRIEVQQASVLNIFNGTTPQNLTDIADYYFLVEPLILPEAAKIGISLSEPSAADANSLTISAFSAASKADEAGLRINDSIIAIDNFPINSMEDVRIALFDSVPGDVVQLTVERSVDGIFKELVYEVELVQPAMERPHP